MEFGLWVEPEMVNPDSDLYRAHPDWVMNFPGRPRSELAQSDGAESGAGRRETSIFPGFSTSSLRENNIRYFKWDMNRIVLPSPAGPKLPVAERKSSG